MSSPRQTRRGRPPARSDADSPGSASPQLPPVDAVERPAGAQVSAGRQRPPRSALPSAFFNLSASIEAPARKGPQLAHSKPPVAAVNCPHLPPTTEIRRFNTTRLLPAKYSESVLTRLADNDEDLQLIFALENATNERLLAEQNLRLGITARELVFRIPHYRIINAAFTHPHPQGSRFALPYRGAWYAGFELATAKAEVLFHRMLQFAEIRWNAVEELDYDQYLADFCGTFHDLRPEAFDRDNATGSQPGAPGHVEPPGASGAEAGGGVQPTLHASPEPCTAADFAPCLDPRSYIASQQLTLDLLEAGSCGILYPSTRRPSGQCIACFRPSLVCNVRKRDLYRLTWYPDRAATFLRCARLAPVGAPA